MGGRSDRFWQGVDLVGVGYGWAMIGGAGAGALYGIAFAGVAVGSMARARMARAIDIAFGLAIFGGLVRPSARCTAR
jgi:hypothetical protein